MARRWTPRRFVVHRRIRVAVCAATVAVASVLCFGIGARKSVALDINGESRVVSTYAMSVDRLLEEQGVDVKTHDVVQSTSGTDSLMNHDVVSVRSAFQTTIVIDGTEVPFWTVATSADQLLGFFASNEADAAKVTVNIANVYNQLTGGFVINQSGPVTVIWDGQTSVAPDGKLPAASILDSKGITLGKEDRVSVEKDGDATILRVQRVTHTQTTKIVPVEHGSQTIVDPNLAPGATEIRQQGQDGEITETYNTTLVDGVEESSTLISSQTTKAAVDTVIAVGPEPEPEPEPTETPEPSTGSDSSEGSGTASANNGSSSNGGGEAEPGQSPSASSSATTTEQPSQSSTATSTPTAEPSTSSPTPTETAKPSSTPTPTSTPANDQNSNNSGNSGSSNNSNSSGSSGDSSLNTTGSIAVAPSGLSRQEEETWREAHDHIPASMARLYHPTVAQAKAYAKGAAAQRGWTGDEWSYIEQMWQRESSWRWNADNPSSTAYGIPQMLPGWTMGYGWLDDGAVQIDSGLKYIAQRYGNPTKAWEFWQANKWY